MPQPIVYHISTFSPTQCGIATYTEDLIRCSKKSTPYKVRMIYDNELSQLNLGDTIVINNIGTYDRMIDAINMSNAKIVSLQHEFGIFGGKDGEYVIRLAQGIRKPIVTTLHTVFPELSISRKNVLSTLIDISKFVVALTEESGELIASEFKLSLPKIKVITHGIPNVEFIFPETSKIRDKISANIVFVSAGHLRPAKGYEIALKALARYKGHSPNFKYLILGSEQPQSNKGGKEYRFYLQDLIRQLNLEENIIWVDQYLSIEDFLQYIMSADVGLVTYTRPFQNSSGILPIILGCGRLAISTDFNYGKSVAKKVKGIRLAEMNNPDDVYEKICEISQNRDDMHALMQANYLATRDWIWENAAARYEQLFHEVLADKQ